MNPRPPSRLPAAPKGERGGASSCQKGPAAASSKAEIPLLLRDPAAALEQAQGLYRAAVCSGNMAGMVAARIQGGYAQFYRGDYHTAKLYLNEARALAQELGQPSQQAHALAGLGATYGQTGQYGEALKCQLESLRLVQGLSDRRVESRALNAVGQLYFNLRDYDQAVRYHTDAYDLACEEGAVMLELSAAINLAVAYLHSGNASRALSLNEDVLARIAGQELHQMEAVVRGNLAATLEQLGRLDEALTACEEALRMALQLGLMEDARCDNLIIRATVLGQLGRYPEAITDLQLALQMAARLDSRQREREAYREMARVLEAMGNAQGALGALQRFYRLETEALTVISQERTKVLALQLQLDRLEHRAAEQELRNEELAAINAHLQAARDELAYHAAHDSLTGLLNRPALERLLELACTEQPAEPGAVLFIDLDHFKQINDTLGHPVGDQLLRQVAQRLRSSVGPNDVVARQGGDEFTVLLRGVDSSAAEERARLLLERLASPYTVDGMTLYTTASIGVALFPLHGQDVTALQKYADLALYQAKQERGRFSLYKSALGAEALEQLTVEQALHAALKQGDFYLHYQPVIDLETGQPFMIEALLRWRSPWGEVPPQTFVPVAERSDLILHISAWAVRTALEQLRKWRRLWPELKISVNVAARQLTQPDLSWQLEKDLTANGLELGALVLEITETTVVDSYKLQHLRELQEAGLQIGLDDVGTGYASLVSLAELPIQMLKIDRSLTAQLFAPAGGRSTRPLVYALVTFAQESGLAVVVEGVEEPGQLQLLRQWGPMLLQGHLESRAHSADQITAYLRQKAKEHGLPA